MNGDVKMQIFLLKKEYRTYDGCWFYRRFFLSPLFFHLLFEILFLSFLILRD